MCVWYSGWPGGFTVLPLRHAGLEAPAMQAWLLLPCSPRWGTRRTRVHMCLWRTSLFNNENLNWTLGHNFTAQHNYLTCWCTSIYMADVILSPFFFMYYRFSAGERKHFVNSLQPKRRRRKKKPPNHRFSLQRFSYFHPLFSTSFFFSHRIKYFRGQTNDGAGRSLNDSEEGWKSGYRNGWREGGKKVRARRGRSG